MPWTGDDLLFDLEEGPGQSEAPAASLTSFTGSQSKPLSISYSSSPEPPTSPMPTPRRKQLGMPIQANSLFSAGSYQDSQDSSRTGFSASEAPVTASSAMNGGRWPTRGPIQRHLQTCRPKHGSRFHLHHHAARPCKQVGIFTCIS